MKRLPSIIAGLLITGCTYAQNTPIAIKHQTDISTVIKKTLTVSTSGYTVKTVENLQEELSNWKGKVIDISIDSSNQLFILKHNSLMNEKELFEVLDKYNVTKQSIVSYQ